ncbi:MULTISPECIES: Uma2 family endonuclease [Planktothrix]|jgi:Uma2 family endonuclease|uniref:Uma2 family endonuclease n=1 Tax=Planktothrix TaxID=54304 RepID=UPI0004240197|nr:MULTISPECIES: Uma2 family endonuclease [Planktothrix]
MTHATTEKIMSLQEFLNYAQDTDTGYELEDGRLLLMPTESEINRRIACFLFAYFLQLGVSFSRLTMKTELVVMGSRTTVRVPDLMVLTETLAQVMEGASRSLITIDMPPPEMVVEVVSPGQENQQRDYRYKRSQYQARGIPEYWIIDPIQQQITVFILVTGLYEQAIFTGDMVINSSLLSDHNQPSPLTASQLLQTQN